jgi:hypothetical protein
MNTKEAKGFLVQQVAEQAALERVPLSDLEKRMLYFVENDPSSCENPLELNDEFEAQYDTSEYENKIAQLLSDAFKRIKAGDPQKVALWDSAMRLLSRGDHYLPVMWRGDISNGENETDAGSRTEKRHPDLGNRVVKCGSIAIAAVMLGGSLILTPNIPSWIGGALVITGFFLSLLTLVFLVQQGYRAFRRKFGRSSQ